MFALEEEKTVSYLEKYFKKFEEGKRSSAAIAYLSALDHLQEVSPEIGNSIKQELLDQRKYLKLIASENYSSLSTQLAMGNLLTDKYAEGVIKKRFYAGCDNIDDIESRAANELKNLFGCDHAYVQPHSGADANLVAFWAILTQRLQNKEVERLGKKTINELSDDEHESLRQLLLSQKVMGLSLNSGGHLTHGYRMNVSSKIFRAYSYDVNPKTGVIDYAELEKQVLQVKPFIFIAGYSAYPRLLDFAKLREICDKVGAVLMGDIAHFSGLVAGEAITGVYNPVPYCHVISSTTHKTLRGPRGGMVLCTDEFKDAVDKGCPMVLGGPLPHVMAAKAVAFKEASTKNFKEYAKQIIKNSKAMAEEFLKHGVSLFSGGTDNHLIVIDVQSSFGITGRQAELALRKAFITVNRNTIPFDINGPWYTSGVRIGTPALTTRGFREEEVKVVARAMIEYLKAVEPGINPKNSEPSKAAIVVDEKVLNKVSSDMENLLEQFPLYPELVVD